MKPLIVAAWIVATLLPLGAAEYPKEGADIYDSTADGTALITQAQTRAAAEHKNILLDFGANWCPWCHRLHGTMNSDAAVRAELDHDYIVVMVDVNMRKGVKRNADVNARYGNPIHEGLPVLVVLDSSGKQLVTQESGILEEGDHHDPAKVLAFLKRWAPANG